jgi:hypothetical protein
LGDGCGANNPTRKKQIVTRSEKATAGWTYLRWKGKRSKDLKIGSWNPRYQACRREELEELGSK